MFNPHVGACLLETHLLPQVSLRGPLRKTLQAVCSSSCLCVHVRARCYKSQGLPQYWVSVSTFTLMAASASHASNDQGESRGESVRFCTCDLTGSVLSSSCLPLCRQRVCKTHPPDSVLPLPSDASGEQFSLENM